LGRHVFQLKVIEEDLDVIKVFKNFQKYEVCVAEWSTMSTCHRGDP